MIDTAHKRAPLALVAVTLAVGLAACGSSSSSKPKTTTTTTASTGNGPPAALRARVATCLRSQGLTPPQRRPGGGFGFRGGPPAANSRFRAALQKCGIRIRGGRGRFLQNPAARQALDRFVACVRRNGFDLPAPNMSGNGPIFDPTKVNRNDPKLMAAARKCQSLLPRGRGLQGPGGTPGAA